MSGPLGHHSIVICPHVYPCLASIVFHIAYFVASPVSYFSYLSLHQAVCCLQYSSKYELGSGSGVSCALVCTSVSPGQLLGTGTTSIRGRGHDLSLLELPSMTTR